MIRRFDKVVGEPGSRVPYAPTPTRRIWIRLVVNAGGTFCCVFGGSLLFLALAPIAAGFRPVVVSSGSMEPTLRTADVVVTDAPEQRLAVGSVVDYWSGDGAVIHRIVEVTADGYRTKGDANPTPDDRLVRFGQVRGVGVMLVPFVGLPEIWFHQGEWVHLVVLMVGLIAAMWVTPMRWVGESGDFGPSPVRRR